jgi:hypothetical protein
LLPLSGGGSSFTGSLASPCVHLHIRTTQSLVTVACFTHANCLPPVNSTPYKGSTLKEGSPFEGANQHAALQHLAGVVHNEGQRQQPGIGLLAKQNTAWQGAV